MKNIHTTLDRDVLRKEIAAFPNIITGDLAKVDDADPRTLDAAQTAVYSVVLLKEHSALGLGDYLMSFGVTISNSGKLQTENRLGLEATKMGLSFEIGKYVSWRVGKPEEGKSVNLLPSRKGWLNVLMKDDQVLRVRPATAEDFQKAPDFKVSSPAIAHKLWHKAGEIHWNWAERFENGESFTASLPPLPGAQAKKSNKPSARKHSRNRRRQAPKKA
jgi:hypothetical protein